MDRDLENIKTTIAQSSYVSEAEKESLLSLIKAVDKKLTIVEFKLNRTEMVKRTTSVLLEETIDELEKKRSDVEEINGALMKSLEELKAAQAQLIQAEKMASLGELTAGIAHEIQNPLNFVNNFSELNQELADELEEELNKGDIEEAKAIALDIKANESKINHHGKRAEAIVKGMLQHSRKTNAEKEPTNINELADEYLRLAYHGRRAKDQSFNANLVRDFGESIGDINIIPQDIGRVLLNLINNAFYACKQRKRTSINLEYKPTVSVSTIAHEGNVKITVQDNGDGIPEDVIDKIYQPFFTTKPTGQGTGLGLSLSYDIVKAHGGELSVESRQGEGTEFTVSIPIG